MCQVQPKQCIMSRVGMTTSGMRPTLTNAGIETAMAGRFRKRRSVNGRGAVKLSQMTAGGEKRPSVSVAKSRRSASEPFISGKRTSLVSATTRLPSIASAVSHHYLDVLHPCC